METNMSRTLGSLATLAVLAGSVSAQSTVTVFGLVDLNVRSVTTGGATVRQMGTDGLYNSRLGFRAEEDLGGGLKAGAWLEAALNPDTGTINGSGKFWHRRSTVSLWGRLGEVRIGRDLDPSFYNLSVFDPFGTCGVGSGFNLASNLGSGAATLLRTDNAVSYFLPSDMGGLYGQLQVAAGERVPGNAYVGARLGYQRGPLNVAAAAATTRTATSNEFKVINGGVSYDIGGVRLMGLLSHAKYGGKKQLNWELGALAPLGELGQLRASYQRADASGAGTDANDAMQLAVGYLHHLSKGTSVYATYARLNNDGGAAFAVGSPPASKAGASSSGYELGLRHSF
jgi:predicted porin